MKGPCAATVAPQKLVDGTTIWLRTRLGAKVGVIGLSNLNLSYIPIRQHSGTYGVSEVKPANNYSVAVCTLVYCFHPYDCAAGLNWNTF